MFLNGFTREMGLFIREILIKNTKKKANMAWKSDNLAKISLACEISHPRHLDAIYLIELIDRCDAIFWDSNNSNYIRNYNYYY